MLEIAQALAFLAALLMVVSFAIWTNRLRGPLLRRLDGARASNARPAEVAINLLTAAVGLSGVAAGLAVVRWISF